MPVRLISVSASLSRSTSRGASPSDSSSIIRSLGRDMIPRPIAHICCSPPDSVMASCRWRSRRIGNSEKT